MARRASALALGLLLAALQWLHSSPAAEKANASKHPVALPDDPTKQTDENWIDDRWQKTEIGPFLSTALELSKRTVVKAVAIKVGDRNEAAVAFDTELLEYAAGWSGGFLRLNPRRYGLIVTPRPDGAVQFSSRPEPDWARQGSFT